jgi:transaldolase
LPADGGDCEEKLAQFAKAGIDDDVLATRLQDEGASSFVKSWNDLLDVLKSKCRPQSCAQSRRLTGQAAS